ncbi:hypothetical protein [Helicobacter pylori]|uniref:hypothetical protein n=1 Tax=Helicobacter pylori TaxID=210 RepID=UPI001E60246E|nr:hypothetical protein [Helicobacter pylori]
MTHEKLLAVKYNELWEAHQRLIKEKGGLGILWEAHQRLSTENDELQKRIQSLEQSQQDLRNRNAELKIAKDNLTTEKYHLNNQLNASQKQVKELEQSQQDLRNRNAELTEKIKALSTERDELIASHTDKSELDLQNRRFKSAIEDLKRQNRKLEEENMALKERVDGLKEQLSKQPKPQ